jgi:uncharacterized membrane protein
MKTLLRETLSGWRAAYLAVVTAATIAAQVTHGGHYYLVAVVLTAPCAVGAIVGVYVAYGLGDQLVTLVHSGMSADQVSGSVFALTAPINVALFAAAAIGNIVLLRLISDVVRERNLRRVAERHLSRSGGQ